MFGLAACNQAADPCLVNHNGALWIYYDGTDNTTPAGAIGVAVYNGPMGQYAGCDSQPFPQMGSGPILLPHQLPRSFMIR
jgi:hypothetical protein